MATMSRLAGALLVTSALTWPAVAAAQETPEATSQDADQPAPEDADQTASPDGDQADQTADQGNVEVSVPGGGEIIVTGRRTRNVQQVATQVVSVLSSAEIARTGEGDIAGALSRVTGLSVVGKGFVYVRGLGDRYSLALLNGSPLPSPEPLKRVVPLDLFPTGVIASSLVQKSYSANFPGEFGGGVINLTTKATPDEPFLTISGGVSGDSITTFHRGLSYYGSSIDWTGYTNANRDIPPALQAFLDSGKRLSSGDVDSTAIAAELGSARNTVVQILGNTPANWKVDLSGGKTWDIGDTQLGVIVAAGYQQEWVTRQPLQQTSLNADLSQLETDFKSTLTDEHLVVNGLFGMGLEFGDNRIRWTNLYIHDTDKQARTGLGQRHGTTVDYMQQRTAWYERQLLDSQLVGEFKITPDLELDVRGGFANSKRDAPFEQEFEYARTNVSADPYGAFFVNRLNNGQSGDAGVTFSKLNEDLWSGGGDLSYNFRPGIRVTIGGSYSDTHRTSSRRDFKFLMPNNYQGDTDFISVIGLLRPDYLLSAPIVNLVGTELIETDEGNPAFAADLVNWAAYAKTNLEIGALSIDAGVRYEDAKQDVEPIQVFTDAGSAGGEAHLDHHYWLPAVTLTYEVQPGMQLRLSGSKTIARPQFRELLNQPYYDPDTNRSYRGNPLLDDSQLYNAEARFEYYLAPEERVSVAGFFKRIDHPIEAFVTGLDFVTAYANAPQADLYGGEFEAQKYFDLFEARRLLVVANYTYTKSELKVGPDDLVDFFGSSDHHATSYFRDGAPLTGQSDHVVNLQIGLEDSDHLSQQTFLISYASNRVISRGLNGSVPQPDVIEKPGVQLDFVAREGFELFGMNFEAKLEVRNILATGHEEFQQSGDNRIDVNTYDVGRKVGVSLSTTF